MTEEMRKTTGKLMASYINTINNMGERTYYNDELNGMCVLLRNLGVEYEFLFDESGKNTGIRIESETFNA